MLFIAKTPNFIEFMPFYSCYRLINSHFEISLSGVASVKDDYMEFVLVRSVSSELNWMLKTTAKPSTAKEEEKTNYIEKR